MKKSKAIPKGWRKLRVGERCNSKTYWFDFDSSDLTKAWCAENNRSLVLPGHRVAGYEKGTIFITPTTKSKKKI